MPVVDEMNGRSCRVFSTWIAASKIVRRKATLNYDDQVLSGLSSISTWYWRRERERLSYWKTFVIYWTTMSRLDARSLNNLLLVLPQLECRAIVRTVIAFLQEELREMPHVEDQFCFYSTDSRKWNSSKQTKNCLSNGFLLNYPTRCIAILRRSYFAKDDVSPVQRSFSE